MTHQQNMVKRTFCGVRILSLFMTVVLLWSIPALTAGSSQQRPIAQSPQILWKVQSAHNTIYLAGSIHVLQKHDYPLHHTFDDAFSQSSRVIFEVDLDGLSSPLAQKNMLKKGFYLNGEILANVLSKDSYAMVKTQLAELGLQIAIFHRMKPWMIATAVMTLELKKLGFESAYGVDQHFFEKTQAAGKTIQGLETVEFQLNLFDQLPLSIQEQFLLQTLEELKTLDTQVNEMVKAWKEGNVQHLEALLAGMRDYPELYQALIVKRNKAWLPFIESALQEKMPVFIVVGALHLVGKKGLVSLLKEQGYLVVQL